MRRTTSSEIPLPITYTPTTHRISKAKKGKRVHACEFPGCNKVFTRAEHRRRHELNHNPEALFRCTQTGCKKSFHRPDLLARHMERHELEAQMENTTQWERNNSVSIQSDRYTPKCGIIDSTHGMYLAATQPPSAMSLAPMKGLAIHPDLTGDCGLVWNGVEVASEQQTPIFPNQRIHDSVEDTRLYPNPDACPSPLSDGTTLSVPSYPRSSVSSTPVTAVDSYPETIMDSELTSSPVPMHATLRTWDQPENAYSNIVPISMADNLIHPALQYQSQPWTGSHHMSYNESVLPGATPYPATVPWKSWSL